mmetsp:Transcript_12250/g.13839  ORF Transcript_12250/g.13839 Transcript_12250/m.13839 type:complete len:81 (-) Transcript_12250:744-986(-)
MSTLLATKLGSLNLCPVAMELLAKGRNVASHIHPAQSYLMDPFPVVLMIESVFGSKRGSAGMDQVADFSMYNKRETRTSS